MSLRSMRAVALSLSLSLALGGLAHAKTNEEGPKKVTWSFQGLLGKFDQAEIQRGYKVYKEVCASCHGMDLLYFRNLSQKDGPFYDPKHPNPNNAPIAKALAAEAKSNDIDPDTGDAMQRASTVADHFPNPYPNEAAARGANGGALPPDLSVMTKAREGGPEYVYSLLTGYHEPPKGLTVPAGKYYNPYYPGDLGSYWTGAPDKVPVGGFISMPFQLTPDRVTYDDGTKATTDRMAKDVVAFLAWASEPKQIERKQTGIAVLLYLFGFAGLTYASYRRIWRNVAH